MPALDTLTFATPWALAALALLPVIWWLLRFTPPRPETIRFAPFRLLLDLVSREEETDKTPWWLVALRLLIAGLVIFAVARPLLSEPSADLAGRAPVLIVVDDTWAAAGNWDNVEETLSSIIDSSDRSGLPVALATTVPGVHPAELSAAAADTIRERAAALQPKAQFPDRPMLLERLQAAYGAADRLNVLWLSDGVDHGHAAAFATGLTGLANGTASVQTFRLTPGQLGPALTTPALEDGKLKFAAIRAGTSDASNAVIELRARNGRSLADAKLTFKAGTSKVAGEIVLPLELRNDAAALHITGQRSAGAVHLLDDRWRRKAIALMSGASFELEQPLLSPLYYASRALQPSAELYEVRSRADLREKLDAGLSMIVLADVGKLGPSQLNPISEWVESGGVLVRFAGPRLAGGHDELVPVELRTGGRALGSALSWEQPQRLAPFPEAGPFAGLAVDDTVTVKRQVLAQPSPELSGKVWASLEDGTPLITASKQGSGLIILFHVTANGDWSNLPFTGLFVELLLRVLDLAPGVGAADGAKAAAGDVASSYVPVRALSGFGTLTAPPVDASPIAVKDIAKATVSAIHPAGLYQRAGASRALNLKMPADGITALPALPTGITASAYETSPPVPLTGPVLTLALCLFLADCLAALFLSGAWYRLKIARTAAGLILALLLAASPVGTSWAQDANLSSADRFAMRNAGDTRLAYVRTGRKSIDDVSFAGLAGLTDKLTQRTSVEPGLPTGIDIERDQIVFFPLLYWPILPDAKPLSEDAIAKVDRFMKNGGTIFFDTRDSQTNIAAFTGQASEATLALRRILATLDIPRLVPVPPEHVLTKSFYLLQSFPGRWADGDLWVEDSQQVDRENTGNSDGVTSIIIGSNDYAAAWAQDATGRPIYPAVPGGERQREFAVRTGINTVMYALTGNYKADQVHIPALLERLGQ
ncbi:MAG: DUF4159 domain-containing protein [Rhizobiales bacterium]|nr:DUF4159 domain-containing protein [Hyphomicrobiales bacterium]